MWKRKTLKTNAKIAIKKNYLKTIIVCLIMAFLVGNYTLTLSTNETPSTEGTITIHGETNSEIVENILNAAGEKDAPIIENKATNGVIANIFNNSTKTGSFMFGVLNSINQFLFKDRVFAGVTLLIGAILSFLYWLFVGNILRVGELRFFLESRTYSNTQVNRLLFVYKTGKIKNVSKTMLKRGVYTVLWSLTIVGGIIKYYSYKMIPYIIAENPNISSKEAFKISSEMMKGNKWKTFKLDVSFILWNILSSITFGLLGMLWVFPYKTMTETELYATLRNEYVKKKNLDYKLLNDTYLYENDNNKKEYPISLSSTKEIPKRKWINANYKRDYSKRNLLLLFFIYSVIGWLWEVLLYLIQQGEFINRGTLLGPWLPIYGVGGVLCLVLLKRFRENKVLTFFLVFLICGIIEYTTGWYLLTVNGSRWWDYTGYFLNINGFVCLEGLLVFALAGSLSIYLLSPIIDDKLKKFPDWILNLLCATFLVLFSVDFTYSSFFPNSGKGITE